MHSLWRLANETTTATVATATSSYDDNESAQNSDRGVVSAVSNLMRKYSGGASALAEQQNDCPSNVSATGKGGGDVATVAADLSTSDGSVAALVPSEYELKETARNVGAQAMSKFSNFLTALKDELPLIPSQDGTAAFADTHFDPFFEGAYIHSAPSAVAVSSAVGRRKQQQPPKVAPEGFVKGSLPLADPHRRHGAADSHQLETGMRGHTAAGGEDMTRSIGGGDDITAAVTTEETNVVRTAHLAAFDYVNHYHSSGSTLHAHTVGHQNGYADYHVEDHNSLIDVEYKEGASNSTSYGGRCSTAAYTDSTAPQQDSTYTQSVVDFVDDDSNRNPWTTVRDTVLSDNISEITDNTPALVCLADDSTTMEVDRNFLFPNAFEEHECYTQYSATHDDDKVVHYVDHTVLPEATHVNTSADNNSDVLVALSPQQPLSDRLHSEDTSTLPVSVDSQQRDLHQYSIHECQQRDQYISDDANTYSSPTHTASASPTDTVEEHVPRKRPTHASPAKSRSDAPPQLPSAPAHSVPSDSGTRVGDTTSLFDEETSFAASNDCHRDNEAGTASAPHDAVNGRPSTPDDNESGQQGSVFVAEVRQNAPLGVTPFYPLNKDATTCVDDSSSLHNVTAADVCERPAPCGNCDLLEDKILGLEAVVTSQLQEFKELRSRSSPVTSNAPHSQTVDNSEVESLRSKCDGLMDEGIKLSKKLGTFEERCKKLRTANHAAEKQMQSLTIQNTQLTEKLAKASSTAEHAATLETKIMDLTNELSVKTFRVDSMQFEARAAKKQLEEYASQLKNQSELQLVLSYVKAALAKSARDNEELLAANVSLNTQLQKSHEQLTSLEATKEETLWGHNHLHSHEVNVDHTELVAVNAFISAKLALLERQGRDHEVERRTLDSAKTADLELMSRTHEISCAQLRAKIQDLESQTDLREVEMNRQVTEVVHLTKLSELQEHEISSQNTIIDSLREEKSKQSAEFLSIINDLKTDNNLLRAQNAKDKETIEALELKVEYHTKALESRATPLSTFTEARKMRNTSRSTVWGGPSVETASHRFPSLNVLLDVSADTAHVALLRADAEDMTQKKCQLEKEYALLEKQLTHLKSVTSQVEFGNDDSSTLRAKLEVAAECLGRLQDELEEQKEITNMYKSQVSELASRVALLEDHNLTGVGTSGG